MSADRELLELAAKAAAMDVQRSRLDDPINRDFLINGHGVRNEGQRSYPWNPLTDDGDALRLAMRLNISISMNLVYVSVSAIKLTLAGIFIKEDTIYEDHDIATRRAIVRAAAALAELPCAS